MAKYSITHICGHKSEANLVGKVSERENRIKSMEQRACRECAAERHNSGNLDATITNRINGLPILTSGSDKQTAWAESIRREKLAEVDALIAKLWADPRAQEEPSLMAAWEAAQRAVRGKTAATYWIDNRNTNAAALMRGLVQS